MKSKSLILLLTISIGLFFSAVPSKERQVPSDRPNILWIIANDLCPDLGSYGNTLVHTPNLDLLSKEGVVYENFFTTASTCSPSRSAFITGMYATSIRSQNQFPNIKKPLPDPVIPITEYFKKAGYLVTNSSGVSMEKMGSTGYNFVHDSKQLYSGKDWRERKDNQPFFAQIQLTHAHRPFKNDPSHPIDVDKVTLPPYYPDHPIARKDWALYLETIQLLDKQIGSILKRLKDDGLAENTIVFFFGDHGRPHVRGKQFLYDGGIHAPLIVRWPKHLQSGERNKRLVSNIDLAPAILNLANIQVPTYMQGLDFMGKTSKPREYVFAARDRCDETIDRIRAVRTKDFKYIRNFYPEKPYTQFNAYKKFEYPVLTLMQVMQKNRQLTPEQLLFMAPNRPAEELYDLRNDPYELNNLTTNKNYQSKLTELRKQLDQWLATADKGEYPEESSEIAFAKELMKNRYIEGMKQRGLSPDISDEDYLEYWERDLQRVRN